MRFLVDANVSPDVARLLRPLATTQIAAMIIDNLDTMASDLTAGAIVTFARGRLRSRRLPLH